MALTSDLISQFVKATRDNDKKKQETVVYGTTVEVNGKMYVKIDGSDLLTPVVTTSELKPAERVSVMIKDHNAVVTGNITTPSASTDTTDGIKQDVNNIYGKIANFEVVIADKVSTQELEAKLAVIDEALIGKATIGQLEAVEAKIKNLNVDKLQAQIAEIDKALIGKAEITDLEAIDGKITSLSSNVAKLETVIGGNLTMDNIQSLVLTSSKVTVDNAFIKDAMIDRVSASKLDAGIINTNNVNLQSEDGSMTIVGSLQQFRDKNKNVRIQLGKDSTGDFTFALYGEDGKGQLINQNGITASAIGDGLIVNDMVSNNAAIDGGKLNINSVVNEINNGNTTIKGTKIYLDDKKQTLDVAFNKLSTTVTNLEGLEGDITGLVEKVESNTTSIQTAQGKIQTLVANTTITKQDGQTVQLKDDYSEFKQTVDGISSKVNSLETNYAKTLKSTKTQYYSSLSAISLVGGNWTDAMPEWKKGKYIWQRLVYIYSDGTQVNGQEVCIQGTQGEQGPQGPQGPQGLSGQNGIGIKSITEYYQVSTSNTTQPATWVTNPPTLTATNKYLWNYEKITYTNDTIKETAKRVIGVYGDKGNTGATGQTGPQGPQGQTGATGNGIKTIVNKYLATNLATGITESTSGWTDTIQNVTSTNKYLWNYEVLTYTNGNVIKTTPCIIGVYGDKGNTGATGPQGPQGPQGIQGPKGENGQQLYTWVKYADSPTSGISDDPTNKKYIGLAYNKTTSNETTNYSDYTWSLIKGDKGDTGATGQSVSNVIPQFTKHTSPTTAPGSTATWVDTCPAYERGKFLWIRNKVIFTNPSATKYTNPYYEPSWDAKATADDAKETVTTKVSEFKQTLDGISTKVGQNTSKINEVQSTVTSQGTSINQMKGEIALKVESSYVDKKLDTLSGAVDTKISQAKADMKLTTDAITQRVSSTETKVTTVTNTANAAKTQADKAVADAKTASDKATTAQNSANNANNALTIYQQTKMNGLELFNNDYKSNTSARPFVKGTYSIVSATEIAGASDNESNIIKVTNGQILYTEFIACNVNNPYYASIEIYNKDTNNGTNYIQACYYDKNKVALATNEAALNIINGVTIPSANTWHKLEGWVNAPAINDLRRKAKYVRIRIINRYNGLTGITYWRNISWKQLGSGLLDDTQEIKTEISTTKNKVSSIETDLKGITSRVQSVETNQTNTGNKVTSLETWKKEAEQKITETAITNTVKKNFYTKTETDKQITSKGYQTASQVQQTVNGLEVKVSQSGGYNLIKNSTGAGYNTNSWIHNGSSLGVGYNDTIGSNCRTYMFLDNGTTTSEKYAFSSRFKLKPNTKYTFVGYFHNYNTCSSFDVYLLSSTSLPDTDSSTNYTNVQQLIATASTSGTWKKYKITITTPANTMSGYIRIDNNGYNSSGGSDPNRVHWNALMLTEGELELPWSSAPNEMYDGITTIDKDGIKISMQDGEGTQGYTRIAHDGMEIFNGNGGRTAHFGDNNTAYIQTLTADKINNRYLLKWNEGRPTDLYIAPNATGDGTGRDANNKANSISNALNWLWNTYGCYSWQRDIIIHVAPGDYWGADNYIGGWIGTGVIYVILEPWACIRSTIRIEECSMTVVIKGSIDPYNIEVQDNAYLYLNSDSYGIYVRNSTVVVAGLNMQCEGWYGDTNTWGDYRGYGVYATDGSNVLVTNCDIVGFWYGCCSRVSSYVSMLNCVGHVGCVGVAVDGGILSYDRALPMSKDGFWRNIGGFLWDSGGTWTSNSKFKPKPSAPQPPPPPPVETWVWTENTFWASSLWTSPEGSGSGTSGRTGQWGQGKWGSYKPHRGYATFSGVNAWCNGGRNFTVELTMTRLNTSHGYGGAVPIPKIKTTNGSFWNCGKAFARGATHTVTLPSDVANALVTGGWDRLEMWAGSSTNDYSFYDNVRIRVVCEKRV